MIEARNAIADLLDNRTLAELRARTNPREPANMYYSWSRVSIATAGQGTKGRQSPRVVARSDRLADG
jgi:hypothetical protein